MSHYKHQPNRIIIDGETLTASFDDTTNTFDVRSYHVATLYIEYTPAEGGATASIQVESGPDAVDLFPKVALIAKGKTGISTGKEHIIEIDSEGAATAVKRRVLLELADTKMRISANEAVSSLFGTMTIIVTRNEE